MDIYIYNARQYLDTLNHKYKYIDIGVIMGIAANAHLISTHTEKFQELNIIQTSAKFTRLYNSYHSLMLHIKS